MINLDTLEEISNIVSCQKEFRSLRENVDIEELRKELENVLEDFVLTDVGNLYECPVLNKNCVDDIIKKYSIHNLRK